MIPAPPSSPPCQPDRTGAALAPPMGRPSCALAVVVHYRDAAATLSCLSRIEAGTDTPRTIVINNAHPDPEGSWPLVAAGLGANAEAIDAEVNAGFAAGSNLGIRRAMDLGAEFVWLVNPDAHPEPSALSALLRAARANPRLAAVGSRLLSPGSPDAPEQPGGTVSVALGRADACSVVPPREYDFISGASVLLRVAALREAGLFDERLFLYWEDVDLCLRLRKAGWQLAVEAESRVTHQGGGAVGRGSPTQDYYAARNALLVSSKHAPATFPLAALAVLTRITVGKLLRGEFARLSAALQGWRDGLLNRGGIRSDAGSSDRKSQIANRK